MSDSKMRRFRDAASGPGTLISEGCRIQGVLTGNGHFMINGEVDGDCDIAGSVTLAKDGHWKGTLKAEEVIQFSLSLRKSLRKELARLADDADMTMRAFVLEALRSKGLSVTVEDLRDLRRRGGEGKP